MDAAGPWTPVNLCDVLRASWASKGAQAAGVDHLGHPGWVSTRPNWHPVPICPRHRSETGHLHGTRLGRGVQYMPEPGFGRRVDAGKKYKTGVSRCELPCKINRAEIVDLYQTRLAEPRFVKISRFRAREEARPSWAEFTKRHPIQRHAPPLTTVAHTDNHSATPSTRTVPSAGVSDPRGPWMR